MDIYMTIQRTILCLREIVGVDVMGRIMYTLYIVLIEADIGATTASNNSLEHIFPSI